jgi:hypothetical protein
MRAPGQTRCPMLLLIAPLSSFSGSSSTTYGQTNEIF